MGVGGLPFSKKLRTHGVTHNMSICTMYAVIAMKAMTRCVDHRCRQGHLAIAIHVHTIPKDAQYNACAPLAAQSQCIHAVAKRPMQSSAAVCKNNASYTDGGCTRTIPATHSFYRSFALKHTL